MRFFSLILLAALVSGCGQITIKERQSVAEKAVAEDTAINSVKTAAPKLVKTPNPYLENRRSVPSVARKIFEQANNAIQAKRWRDAESILLKLTAQYPKYSGPYLNLGIVYLQLDRPVEQVEQQFTKAITVNPKNLEAYNRLANLKRSQGAFQEAEKLYQKALKIWPQHSASHLNLGILYDLYLNNLVKAQSHYQVYQTLQPEPNRQVAGWLVDIKRRIKTVAQAERQGVDKP